MSPDWRVLTLSAAAGLALGSYAVTAALRATRAESALAGRSHCDACGVPLGFAATLPLVSYARFRGVCAHCGGRIDRMHLAGEAGGLAVLLTAVTLGDPVRIALAAALGLILLAASVIDIRTQRLPNALTLAAAACAGGLALSRGAGAALVGLAWAAGAALLLLAIRGLGDIKLVSGLALWLGAATPWMWVLAAVLGLVAYLVVRPPDRRLAFGPCIALAGWTIGLGMEWGLWPTM